MKRFIRYVFLLLSLWMAQAVASTVTVTYFHNDPAGNPVVETDASGKVVWQESYYPYGGRTVNAAASTDNHLWFASAPYDSTVGLSYMGARYYDPVTGRFFSMDPAQSDPTQVHQFNRYAYANNNPMAYVDPNGRSPIGVFSPGDSDVGTATQLGNYAWATYGNPFAPNGATLLDPVTERHVDEYWNTWMLAGGVSDDLVELGSLALWKLTAKEGLAAAREARDALAAELGALKGKAPATVTAGYSLKSGAVAARACGGGKCAENHVFEALGGAKADVRFTEAIRPRTGAEVSVCARCEATFGRKPFPRNTRFKTDE